MKVRASAASLLLLLAGCGGPQPTDGRVPPGAFVPGALMPGALMPGAAVSDAAAVAALPTELSGFRRTGQVIDYERQPNGAGLGASVRYVPANGERIVATVYFYSGNRPHSPEGAASPDVAQELRATAAEVGTLTRLGRYRAATPQGGITVGTLASPDSIRCALFQVVQNDGARTGDAVCVAVLGGEFVKTRVTAWTVQDPAPVGVIAANLLDAVRKARGTAPGLRAERFGPQQARGA